MRVAVDFLGHTIYGLPVPLRRSKFRQLDIYASSAHHDVTTASHHLAQKASPLASSLTPKAYHLVARINFPE
jgi:hypothetical protein